MPNTFKFEVLTPEKVFYSNEVTMVVFDTLDGKMGIMADHEPMVVAVDAGILKVSCQEKEEFASIGEGFIEITPTIVTAIVDCAEWPDEIDVGRAISAKERAEKLLREKKNDLEMQLMLHESIQRANTRIKAAKKEQ